MNRQVLIGSAVGILGCLLFFAALFAAFAPPRVKPTEVGQSAVPRSMRVAPIPPATPAPAPNPVPSLLRQALAVRPSAISIPAGIGLGNFAAYWGDPMSRLDAADGAVYIWQFTADGTPGGSLHALPGPKVVGDHFAALSVPNVGQALRLTAWKAGEVPAQ